ncbi:MAG TPA: ABC transporter substrate-binding protein [Nitrosopumilus sp.]
MKRTQLLSVVFSLILFTGVTAGNVAFAESDDIIDSFEDCVEAGYPIMESFPEQCMTDDGKVFVNDDNDKRGLDDRLEKFCELNDEEKRQLFADHPRLTEFAERLLNYCEMSEEDREDAINKFIREHFPREHDFDLDDLLDRYCELNDEEKRQLLADHPRLAEFSDRLTNYCEMSEDEQDAIDDLIEEHGDKIRDELRDYSKDYHMDYKKDMREHLEKYCEMSDEDKRAFVTMYGKAEDRIEKMNTYCSLDEDDRTNFIEEHKDEYKAYMKDKMTDNMYMSYDKFCKLTDAELAASTFDTEFVENASKWCDMTSEEREDYMKEHHDNNIHDFDGMSDKAKHHMSDTAKAKLSDKSDRLKAMIMYKDDISDERHEEIRMKYEEKHGDLDERKSELKMKFKNHMTSMKINMSDERKSTIHDRVAEMKAFKSELRERSSELTDEEKQQLREEFIEKAKDMQLAWISPRIQMTAGVDATEVECREGYSLVMKASNGVAMCLKADSALKMIDRGIVVPAN